MQKITIGDDEYDLSNASSEAETQLKNCLFSPHWHHPRQESRLK